MDTIVAWFIFLADKKGDDGVFQDSLAYLESFCKVRNTVITFTQNGRLGVLCMASSVQQGV